MPPTADDTELDESEVLTNTARPYVENENHVPNPTHQYGTYDTSGVAGSAHAQLENVTPIFDVAKQQDLVTAARALDPDDKDVPESLVVMPQGQNLIQVDEGAIKDSVRAKAQEALDNPVVVGGLTSAQQAAAVSTEGEGESNEAKAKAKAETAAASRPKTQTKAEAEAQLDAERKGNSPAGGGNAP